ncbi:LLM class flavin-dependent oxidoreductase [Fictibacillus barbaricus]|uniref:Luciferase family oxidoreductase group 1 n=1 Tax=Fictibacillus barbaricus TaxID=182136 RepID=A0ABU1U0P6_9BACL|nr:LLM class flavin-dependent oxidoreductase [Fictibacillus barbaricus]MDR7073003.1 luciferase family oxidoreductase group 1 [Fictibacillus barbaricus]
MSNDKKRLSEIPLSVLDLAPLVEGGTASDSFKNTLNLAQHAERLGFNRYWLAEHHNMPGIASSATSVVIGYVAGGTSKIRVGSGGIMLPNHAPLVIAEQFGTLESLYPGRIDLGLGRAPGTDGLTAQALRRDLGNTGDDFPYQLDELREYLDPSLSSEIKKVRAIPGEGLNIPIWLLGSSGFSARLAGQLGLPFAFASHFSPDNTLPALELYRRNFKPSNVLEKPYAMVGVNVVAAETDEEAARLATSLQQQFLYLVRGTPTPLKPPIDSMEGVWSPYERSAIEQQLRTTIIGKPETVKEKLQAFLDETQADEMIINGQIYDHQARLRSFEIISEIVND